MTICENTIAFSLMLLRGLLISKIGGGGGKRDSWWGHCPPAPSGYGPDCILYSYSASIQPIVRLLVVFCIGLQSVLSASHAIFVEYFQQISIIPLFPSLYCALTYCVVQVYNVQLYTLYRNQRNECTYYILLHIKCL